MARICKRSVTAATVALALGAVPSRAADAPVVTVNGVAITFVGQPPVSQSGRLLVPLRGVLEKIGATVRYSGPTKTVDASRGDTRIELTLGQTAATVNGKSVTLDVPAQALAGTTLVPLRFVAEALGADVRYDAKTNVVAIRTDGKATDTPVAGSDATPGAGGTAAKAPGKASSAAKAPAPPAEITGTFVSLAKKSEGGYTLLLMDGRAIDVSDDATFLYGGQKIGFDDLLSGDHIAASLDLSTKKIIRVNVSDYDGAEQNSKL